MKIFLSIALVVAVQITDALPVLAQEAVKIEKASRCNSILTDRRSIDSRGVEIFFTPVSHPVAGLGWRDPSGIVWYDRRENTLKGAPNNRMKFEDAKNYCERLGLRLPTRADFEQLALYMGASRDPNGNYKRKGYRPQVLPYLDEYYYLASDSPADDRFEVWEFGGSKGGFFRPQKLGSWFHFRCVGGPS
jgi:formylglycine-generating enzyme required for sulfatase activity